MVGLERFHHLSSLTQPFLPGLRVQPCTLPAVFRNPEYQGDWVIMVSQ